MEEELSTNIDADIIREVGSILSNNSANAFSKMIKDKINVNTEIDFISITDFNMEFIFTKDFSEVFKGISEKLLEGFFLKTSKGADGISVILFNQSHVGKLVDSIAETMGANADSEEIKHEMLKEFSSIVVNAYLSALGNLVHARIEATTPIPARDILATLYDFKEELKETHKDKALMMRTSIKAEDTGIEGKLIILLEPESINKILEKLRGQAGA